MKKKTLLVLSISLIAFLAFLSGVGSVSADSDDYYYAYGKWPTDKSPGVYGHNYVYDNDVYTGHVAEYVVVRLSSKPLLWVQVGWLKRQGWNKAKFYVEWKFEEDHAPIEYFGDAEYNSSHNYKILRSGNYWDVYIDDARVEHLYTTKWSEGDILATSEALDYASPPVNELEGHFWNLRYYSSGWKDWDYINTYSTPPSYCLCEISCTEFTTSGAFPGWSLDWTDGCVIDTAELLEAINYWSTGTPHNGHTVSTCDVQWLINCWSTDCMSQYPC